MNRFSAVVMTALVASLCFLDSARAANALETALVTCWSCHGAEGLPHDPTVPIIQGQQAKYLEKQLRDFREGDREDQIMSSMAESIPFKDLARAAELIAAKTWPARPVEGAPAAEPGVVATCKACHGDTLMGGPSPEGFAPRLSGQFAEYLDAQMGTFARGQRANQKSMTAMMKSLGADERSALAKYLAGL